MYSSMELGDGLRRGGRALWGQALTISALQPAATLDAESPGVSSSSCILLCLPSSEVACMLSVQEPQACTALCPNTPARSCVLCSGLELVRHTPRLEELDLSDTTVGNAGVSLLPRYTRRLRSLHLSYSGRGAACTGNSRARRSILAQCSSVPADWPDLAAIACTTAGGSQRPSTAISGAATPPAQLPCVVQLGQRKACRSLRAPGPVAVVALARQLHTRRPRTGGVRVKPDLGLCCSGV